MSNYDEEGNSGNFFARNNSNLSFWYPELFLNLALMESKLIS